MSDALLVDDFDDGGFGRIAPPEVATLVGLRWLAISGQSAAVLVAPFALGLQFPLIACFACIGVAAALNGALRVRFSLVDRLPASRSEARAVARTAPPLG
ncbi:MAG: hypothetical protein JO234_05125 [Hyphomicrobiales bacterium]|nr:hypothetical protein [Hyphomicrobiales bacterium]